MQKPVTVRTVATRSDVLQVVGLTASAFAEEVRGAGLTEAEWVDLETTELERNPGTWSHIGLACEGDVVLGAVVLKMGGEVEQHMSYWEVNQRVGVCPTFWSYLYDHIMVEHLKPGECLIDFIAVSTHAQGKGVGKMLMKWAEDTATKLIAEREPHAAKAELYLWVAAGNTIAQRLYEKCGYTVIAKTSEDPLSCIMYNIYKSFLGHPVWLRMRKSVALDHLRGKSVPGPEINGAPVVEKIMRRISRSLSGNEAGDKPTLLPTLSLNRFMALSAATAAEESALTSI
ncbi:hypothetical protein WJX72_005555 [[Myrmecia] bisecta]|uniref:N-acetyltransferase domain-containing protein n=1 Tax=[Myrmecia] bisecta TaxID=41462 RepID=A0AAW1PWT8_9CHLO